jgi:hypothetical protein
VFRVVLILAALAFTGVRLAAPRLLAWRDSVATESRVHDHRDTSARPFLSRPIRSTPRGVERWQLLRARRRNSRRFTNSGGDGSTLAADVCPARPCAYLAAVTTAASSNK